MKWIQKNILSSFDTKEWEQWQFRCFKISFSDSLEHMHDKDIYAVDFFSNRLILPAKKIHYNSLCRSVCQCTFLFKNYIILISSVIYFLLNNFNSENFMNTWYTLFQYRHVLSSFISKWYFSIHNKGRVKHKCKRKYSVMNHHRSLFLFLFNFEKKKKNCYSFFRLIFSYS